MYYIEYCTPNSLNRIKTGEDLEYMLHLIKAEGCKITLGCIGKAIAWSKTAQEGKKHYIGCICTIRKGKEQMTEYASY